MKRLLLETNVSKIYVLLTTLIVFLLLASYFSYALFTVNKEKNNAISIVTGNLSYQLKIDEKTYNDVNQIPVISLSNQNSSVDITITLTNPNSIDARFNFYHFDEFPSNVTVGYIVGNNEGSVDTPPPATGVNLAPGESKTYIIRIINNGATELDLSLGVNVGLDYNDLSLPSNGYLFEELVTATDLASVLLADSSNNITTSDKDQRFITGEAPNNYIWYSGKIWHAVSINSDNTVKAVTATDITEIPYGTNTNTSFVGSHAEEWLNDITTDGFLGNLRDKEKFIKMDSSWNASAVTDTSATLPETTVVTHAVGLLNIYEYNMTKDDVGNTFLTPLSGESFATLNTNGGNSLWGFNSLSELVSYSQINSISLWPAVNFYGDLEIVGGSGTESDPYRLAGDNDTALSGTLLNTRYSGEYINFGLGENNLYRIVSIASDGRIKIASADVLRDANTGELLESVFGDDNTYTSSSTIAQFLNGDYIDPAGGYLSAESISMIANGTWDISTVVTDGGSYLDAISLRQARTPKVGLLRLGEQFSGDLSEVYWLLTKYQQREYMRVAGAATNGLTTDTYRDIVGQIRGIPIVRPALYLLADVTITSGDGTKENPFSLTLS